MPRITRAKLSELQVRRIRFRLADGDSQSDIARDYGVTRACINDIARRKTWVDVPVG